ncbi:hypothetical protein RHMOL_Rhmol04G0226500 [Rhododendron molle]|uniref:Uncharacterized protein n=1 Tax=Rhododendron molle TaxID=49168 RepID=A0ACC0P5G4_RHOML|nr:hypothetical protein RHMOL_Rhmol04G0226500 [Rhododendron molle]
MVRSAMWNTEAGTFHPYYLNYLKGLMAVEFSQAGIGETMHIEGKIKRWKRTCYLMQNLIHLFRFNGIQLKTSW